LAARYERRPAHQRGLRNYDSGLRNGFRARRVQTLEGELEVEIPQIRQAAEPFVSKLFPCSAKVLRTEPLRAMVIGAQHDRDQVLQRGRLLRQGQAEQLFAPSVGERLPDRP
jgi:hypothetical protein